MDGPLGSFSAWARGAALLLLALGGACGAPVAGPEAGREAGGAAESGLFDAVAEAQALDAGEDSAREASGDSLREVSAEGSLDAASADATLLDGGSEAAADAGGPFFPFGSHRQRYAAGTILPSHPQAALDRAAASFYAQWKARYLVPGCTAGTHYVATRGDTSGATVSEAHGYGMLATALAAGLDPDAQSLFDGLYRFYTQHPSRIDGALMAWNQSASCADLNGPDSATDGDLDIAYALLLAHRQWGSGGAVDYAAAARRILAAILRREVHPTQDTLLVGDWAAPPDSHAAGTRWSDFMPGHLRAFRAATGLPRWGAVLDREYALADSLQRGFSARPDGTLTGLLPDFAVGVDTSAPRPAPSNWLEGADDGHYAWNSCRVPWRVATDYLLSGEARSLALVRRMNSWVQSATGGDPRRLLAGYQLTGASLSGAGSQEMAFVAPFAVAAMVEGANQAWLDALYDDVVATPLSGQAYFGNSLKLLALFVLTGNFLSP